MKIATTTSDFSRYINSAKDILDAFKQTKFKYLDYSFYNDANKNSLLMSDNFEKEYESIKNYADKLGFKFVQAHSPGGNPLKFDDNYEVLLESTIRSIRACNILGIENTVVHSGVIGKVSKEEYFEKNLGFYKLLYPHMEEYRVNVLIENSMPSNIGDNYFFFTGQEMKEFLEFANHPRLGACWDTGHGNGVSTSQYENITTLGKHLKALHIADNLGKTDDHFAPFFGTVNMDEIMTALIDINYKGSFTFEADNLPLISQWPNKRKEFRGKTALYTPPFDIKLQAVNLLYSIGEHILKTYGVFNR